MVVLRRVILAAALGAVAVAAASWRRAIDFREGGDYARQIAIDASHNIYVLGTCDGETDMDVVVFKLDTSGTVKEDTWVYDSGDDDFAVEFVLDEAGGAVYVLSSQGVDMDDLEGYHISKFMISGGPGPEWTDAVG